MKQSPPAVDEIPFTLEVENIMALSGDMEIWASGDMRNWTPC